MVNSQENSHSTNIYGEMTEYQALEKSSGNSKDVLGVHTEHPDQGYCAGVLHHHDLVSFLFNFQGTLTVSCDLRKERV